MGLTTLSSLVTGLLVLGILTGSGLIWTLFYVLLLMAVAALLWSFTAGRRLEIERHSPRGRLSAGEEFQERFAVTNRGRLPLVWCELQEGGTVPGYRPLAAISLAGGEMVNWTERGRVLRRGRHQLGPMHLSVGDPFGLVVRRRLVGTPTEVLVHPRIHPLRLFPPQWGGLISGERLRGRPVDMPPDVSSVRDYDTHDGQNRIHWSSTARTGRLMSRVYDTQQSADVLVVVDLDSRMQVGSGDESTAEYSISLAASVVHDAVRSERSVGLLINDATASWIEPRRGREQEIAILDHLAQAQPDGTRPLADLLVNHAGRIAARGALVVITCSTQADWVEALLTVASRGARHLCLKVDAGSFDPEAAMPPAVVPLPHPAIDWWVIRRGDDLARPRPLEVTAR